METEAHSPILLHGPRQQFVLNWGDMASLWGVSRTMAQLYALLFSNPGPMDTDEVMEALGISRGNANMNLRKLVEWGLAHKVTKADSRKEYFEAEKDVWSLTQHIVQERRNREILPLLDSIRAIRQQLDQKPGLTVEEEELKQNLEHMEQLSELFNNLILKAMPLLNTRDLQPVNELLNLLP